MNKRIKKKIRRRDNIRSWKRFKDIELITNTVTPEFIAKVCGIPAELIKEPKAFIALSNANKEISDEIDKMKTDARSSLEKELFVYNLINSALRSQRLLKK